MIDLALVVFVGVYAVMIAGRVPGVAVDRTGAALIGAIVLVAAGTLAPEDAWRAIDVGTIGLLFGTMLVSAQFRVAGTYAALTRWLANRPTSPERLLFELVVVTGVLSALLTNDVVCLAIAPVLVDVCVRRRLDPVPFLLALAAAANVGSAATLIGNPQNMLIGQSLRMSFADYLADGCVPAIAGLLIVWWCIARRYRGEFVRDMPAAAVEDEPFDRGQTRKGTIVLAALVVGLLGCPMPREAMALLAGAAVLVSRQVAPRRLFAHVDWQLLVLFAGLFVCNRAFQLAGHAAAGFGWLDAHGVDLKEPAVLFATAAAGSNVISNVPLTMLLLPTAQHPQAGPLLCLATTLAGNLLLVGSIANLIVVEHALRVGVRPRQRSWFAEHLRTGVPITAATLAIAAVWLWSRAGAGS